MKKKYKRKYFSGVQNITNDSLDKSELQNKKAQNSAKTQAVTSSVSAINPIVGGFMSLGSLAGNYTQNENGIYKNKASELIDNQLNVETGISNISKMFSGKTSVSGQANFFTGGLLGKSYDQQEKEETLKKIKEEQILKNANNRIKRGSSTDAMSFAKKGKYKIKSRVIETEGREPIFSPKKPDGTRDLLYFNPNDPTHAEGGVKAHVIPKEKTKYKKGVNKLEGDLISKVIMNRNKDKDFVKRTQATNMFKTWEDFDTKATHKMAYGEDDKGQSYMFPTVLNDNNEAVKVPNQYAEYLSKEGYKKATGMKYKCGTKKMKYANGTKKLKAPIETTDLNKIERYNDSLKIFKSNQELVKNLKDQGYSIKNKYKGDYDARKRLTDVEKDLNSNDPKSREFSKRSELKKVSKNLYSIKDFYPGNINTSLKSQLASKNIEAKGTTTWEKWGIINKKDWFPSYDLRATFDYSNVEPEQPYVLKKKENKKEPVYLTDKKDPRIGNYTEAGNQYLYKEPVITKKITPKSIIKPVVDTRVKTNVEPLTPKQPTLNLPEVKTPEIKKVILKENKKLPGGTGKFAQYPDMKRKLKYKPSTDRMVNAKPVTNIVNTFAKGTKALVIPEGSSIVTAENGMNKKALQAYKRKDFKTLDKIINSMPEDKSGRKDGGSRWTIYTNPKGDEYPGESANTVELRKAIQSAIEAGDYKKAQKLGGYLDKNKNWVYKNPNKRFKYKEEIAAKNNYSDIKPITPKTPSLSQPSKTNSNVSPQKVNTETTKTPDKQKFNSSNIPPLFELAAKAGVLAQGIDKVPENYLYLNRYKYASQLPKILAENNMDTNVAKQNIKNMSAGNTGTYLSNISNLYSQKFKANNAAVAQDTLARQDILNKNVDIDNTEAQVNRSLKDQYADIRARRRGAYQNMLISAGQSADEAVNTYNANKAQDNYNQQYLNVLKDMYPNYTLDENGNKIFKQRKGAKNLKYRRK